MPTHRRCPLCSLLAMLPPLLVLLGMAAPPAHARQQTPAAPSNSGGNAGGGGSETGFSDAAVSVKWRFLDDAPHRPSLALIAGTTFPSGAPNLRENNAQPQLDMESNYNLSDLWQVQANAV